MNRRAVAASVLLALLWMLGSAWWHVNTHLGRVRAADSRPTVERSQAADAEHACPACNLLHNMVSAGVVSLVARFESQSARVRPLGVHRLLAASPLRGRAARAPPAFLN